MSLSQERPTNPAKHFLKVKSGAVSYWDGDAQDNIKVDTPLEFIVLDQLATVKGWSDQDDSGYWSNEVRSVGKDTLTVRTKKGMKEQGIWKDIKGSVAIAGSKYHSSIYIAAMGATGLEIQNLSLTGAALNAWINFVNKNKVSKVKVVLSGWEDAKKGSVSYKVPVFEALPMEDGERDDAVKLDKELQAYLNEYFNYTPEEEHTETVQKVVEDEDETEEVEDEPINLDDIPFN